MAEQRKLLEQLVDMAAKRYGVDPGLMRSFIGIESGWKPGATTGSYKGLFQLSDDEFKRRGGQGDIYNPQANINAGAQQIKALSSEFERMHGRPPNAWELYMTHQQGAGGYAAHAADPSRPAWQSMASTAEGRQKGEGWAKRAIWGNVPDAVKKQYGSVENMTSGDFLNFWKGRFTREQGDPREAGISVKFPGGGSGSGQSPQASAETPPQAVTQPAPAQPAAPTDPLTMIANAAMQGTDLGGILAPLMQGPAPPSVNMPTAPDPRRRVDMSGIMELANRARKSKFGRV